MLTCLRAIKSIPMTYLAGLWDAFCSCPRHMSRILKGRNVTTEDGKAPNNPPVIQVMQANQIGMQLLVHLLVERNELEIQHISKTRFLLADLTLIWRKIQGISSHLIKLWNGLIMMMNIEFTMRWKKAIEMRKELNSLRSAIMDNMKQTEDLSDTNLRKLAVEAEQAWRLARSRPSTADPQSNLSSSGEISPATSVTDPKLSREPLRFEKTVLKYRHKLSQLDNARRRFVREASNKIPHWIEIQQDSAELLKTFLNRHWLMQSELACHVSLSCSRVTALLDKNLFPLRISAHLHAAFEQDLSEFPYSPRIYKEPSTEKNRRKMLFGACLNHEEDLQLTVLHTLLQVARKETRVSRKRQKSADDTGETIAYLEASWQSDPQANLTLVERLPFAMRDALIKLYLSSLPSPLLPISNDMFTKYALQQVRVKGIIRSIPCRNVTLLRDLCDYVKRIAEVDHRATRAYGVLIIRASSNLMSDASNEKTIVTLMRQMIAYFRKELEETVLDISPPPQS